MADNKTIETAEYSTVIEYVTHKQFGLANLGITDKTSYDWRNKGVYLQPKKTKFRMKYSPMEYIWLLLVKSLRDFGIPLKSVIELKEFLIAKIDVEGLLLAIHDESGDSDTVILQELSDEIEKLTEEKAGLRNEIAQLEDHVVNSMFTTLIVSTLMKEKEYVLYIKRDGACLIETLGEDKHLTQAFMSEPCLLVYFTQIVRDFLRKEGVEIDNNL